MHSGFTENDRADLSTHDYSSLELGPSWEVHGFEDQILRHQDGTVFNLSSIDWESVHFYYEYESGNITHVDEEIVSPGRAIALAVFALMLVVGLVGHVMVVFIVARNSTMRRVTYLYLMNLSGACILYLVVCLPALSMSYALVDWRFGRAFCKIENYVMSVTMAASSLTILATGLDHYMARLYPQRFRSFRTVKMTTVLILLVWVTSLATMAPRIPMFEEISVFHKTGAITLCSREASRRMLKLDTVLIFLCVYLLPLLINCVFSYRVTRKSKNTIFQSVKQSEQTGKVILRERRKVAKIIFAISIVFAVGWFPVHLYHLFEDFDSGNVFLGEFIDRGTVALLFSFGANSLSPIFIFLLSSCFKKHLGASFRRILWKRRASSVEDDLESGSAAVNQEIKQEYRRAPNFMSGQESAISKTLLPASGVSRGISVPVEP